MRLTFLRHVIAVMLLPCALTGCGDAKHSNTATASKTAAPASPTATLPTANEDTRAQQARGEALGAYFGLMGDWQAGLASPDNQVGDLLSRHATGQALTLVTDDIQRSRREGIVAKGKLMISPTVTKLDLNATPPVAQVDDCADTSNFRDYHLSDGSPVVRNNGSPGGLQHFLAHVREEGGVWRVYDLHFYTAGSCR
ncbi:hypothetical protein [Catenulispora subtropica]|uniref:Lipoprotein n=1 Tax=Catenulispora subtropica TaxID=450798 RepID=A0ABN2SQ72_9ACTN